MTQANFCNSCGGSIESTDAFCSKCGNTLTKDARGERFIETRVFNERHPLLDASFFGVYLDGRTYLNLLYLILLLPLGIFFFVYAVTCFSTFAGLIPIVVGIFLLYFFLISMPYVMYAQTWLTRFLVGVKCKPDGVKIPSEGTLTQKGFKSLKAKSIWSSFFYSLIVAMPLGIITFTITVTLVSVSIGLMFSWVNLIVQYFISGTFFVGTWLAMYIPSWVMISLYVLSPIVGFFLLTLTLNITNRMAIYHAELVRKIVSN